MSSQLSPHFTLAEMLHSQVASRLGIENAPSAAQQQNLETLCLTLLEPVRVLLGTPLQVDSGFRAPALNEAVGGAADSAHMDGRAADVIPVGIDLRDAFRMIQRQLGQLPVDQAILECDAWLHLAIPAAGTAPRKEFLLAAGVPGRWTYFPAPALA